MGYNGSLSLRLAIVAGITHFLSGVFIMQQKYKTVAIVVTGSEILRGLRVDTNSAWLGRQCHALGWEVVWKQSVGDSAQIGKALLAAREQQVDLIVVSGGLGPTSDDVTREQLAASLGVELSLDQQALQGIEQFFVTRQRSMPEPNRKQAYIPQGCKALANSCGTAPGVFFAGSDSWPAVALLPGPPRELQAMFNEHLSTWLKQHAGMASYERTFSFALLGESQLQQLLGDILGGIEPLELAFCAHEALVDLRVSSTQPGCVEHARMSICSALAEYLVSDNGLNLQETLVDLLARRGLSLSVAESCSGGLLSASICKVPGCSAVFKGGVVSYANSVKQGVLGVPESVLEQAGAVSKECVVAMARNCLKIMDSDFSLAISGIAGPQGGTAEKPLGTVHYALVAADGYELCWQELLSYPREVVQQRSVVSAMMHLLRHLRGQ